MTKAEDFNTFFLSHSTIDDKNSEPPPLNSEPLDANFSEIQVSPEDVFDQIRALSINKAIGPDNISPRLLKEAGRSIVPSLTALFNLSLQKCVMPKIWKRANVVPIHKKDEKHLLSNYRPISLLSIVSKIFEKVVFKYLYNFIHSNNLLSKHQSGFIPGDSTVNQLAYLYHTFCEALDDKKDVRIVFCDVSKAFDRVWHKGLIYKLQKLGIHGSLLSWLRNYLSDRSQRVVIRGQTSAWGSVNAGVPQGSVLGPLLFLVYINDLTEAVDCDIKLFTDDSTLYITVDDHEVGADILNRNLTKIKEWANVWLVNFNPQKTESMVVSNKKSLKYPPLSYDNTQISEVDHHKHLGLTFSRDLSWSNHIQSILAKVGKLKDVMLYLKNRIDRLTLETIYLTYIRPKLEYGSVIWSDCSDRDKNLLEKCQLYFARIVTGARKGTSTDKLYNDVNWPRLEERRQNKIKVFFHKLFYENCPEYLYLLLPNRTTESRYSLRARNMVPQVRARTSRFQHSLIVNGIKIWNDLPKTVQEIQEISLFKRTICTKRNINPLYYIGTRKIQIIHSQIRMNCSLLAAHLHELHVKESPNCYLCGVSENAKHFFMECILHCNHRKKLQNVLSVYNSFNLNCILYGNPKLTAAVNVKIFKAVHQFIVDSKRFDIS